MEHREGFLQGIRNAKIYYQAWLPETECKAVLLVVHGLAEHSGRYMNVVNHFVPLGYAVYGIDHLGHGKSEGTRVYVERFADYTDTLKIYFDMIRAWHPHKPIFLVGHSMGGLIGAAYLLEHQDELAGAVLSGPLVKMGGVSPVAVFMGKLLSTLTPKAGLMALAAEGVSRDPAVVQAYVNDPLVYTGKMTARLAAELIKAVQRVNDEAATITLPLLIVQGSEDKLVDPAGAKLLYDTVSSSDKTLKIYAGFYHEVFNEPEHEQVLSDVEAWLAAHLAQ
ncbi:MAG TPA: lysophospholipase [Anaerolineae bacterium]|nr:lysophospholipase [Anaerolineae bacterium]HQH39992.1 lysophospholipase [Anaerolineae bacterium]